MSSVLFACIEEARVQVAPAWFVERALEVVSPPPPRLPEADLNLYEDYEVEVVVPPDEAMARRHLYRLADLVVHTLAVTVLTPEEQAIWRALPPITDRDSAVAAQQRAMRTTVPQSRAARRRRAIDHAFDVAFQASEIRGMRRYRVPSYDDTTPWMGGAEQSPIPRLAARTAFTVVHDLSDAWELLLQAILEAAHLPCEDPGCVAHPEIRKACRQSGWAW